MYVRSSFPSIIYALDLAKLSAPVMWKYVPQAQAEAVPACCENPGNGLAYHPSGRLISLFSGGILVALDAELGNEIWKTKVVPSTSGDDASARVFAGPVVINDIVLGATFPARFDPETCGGISSWDVRTGKSLWQDRCDPKAGVARGATIGTFAYDPDLNILYYASGTLIRPQGDSVGTLTVSVVARTPGSGETRWTSEVSKVSAPHSLTVNEVILFEQGGKKLLSYVDASGIASTLDRTNGKVLLAKSYASPVKPDVEPRRPSEPGPHAPSIEGSSGATECSLQKGVKTRSPSSYSPVTGLIYFAKEPVCVEYSKAGSLDSRPASWKPQAVTGSGAGASGLVAWDPVRGTTAWEIKGQMSGGVLSTAGGLVFFGTSDGWVRCVNQKTGQVLWSFKMPSGVIGDPISFGGVGGRQFIGVISGIGGWAGIGLGQAMPIPSQPRPGEHLLGSSYEILNASYHTGSKVTAVGGTSSGSPPGGILTVFAVDAPGEVTFAENPLDTIPQFPWPPPKMTDRIVLPRGLVVTGTRDKIGDAFKVIADAYSRAKISYSVYAVGVDGFAVVGRQENITADGNPDDPRWGSDPPPPKGISGYLRGLFTARPGRYRIVALIVRHQSIAPSTKDPTPAEMNALVSRGALSLPDALASKVIDGRCEAFIYEFFRKTEDAPPVLVDNTTIGALKHLLGAGLWTQGELNK